MERLTVTPFGRRPVTSGLMQAIEIAAAPAPVPHFPKWELFRDLCIARAAFGVSDRDLAVLNALLSFHQDESLSDNGNLIVFPSNRALCERAHGMAESTLRRHLAALVHAGLILRHDSPNGKRYAARGADGEVIRAFGFDLRPLLVRAREITHAAAEARAAAEALKRLREEITLMKRDALKLVQYGRESGTQGPWEKLEQALLGFHKVLRRKLGREELENIHGDLDKMLAEIHDLVIKTEDMSANDNKNERHHQNSNSDTPESELCEENAKGQGGHEDRPADQGKHTKPGLPLGLVLKACPDILPYAQDEIRHWHQLVALADLVRPMMGISPDAWAEAQRIMGPETAAITVAGILQRISEINSPGGYLRALTRKAAEGGFSPGPMIMALLRPGIRAA